MDIKASMISEGKDSSSFKVYYRHNHSLIELKFHDYSLTVQQLITKAIEILSDTYMLRMSSNPDQYGLFPAARTGQKIKDGMQISHQQRIRNVGVRRFYLQNLCLSKESISTQINLQLKYGFQKKNRDSPACCSMFFCFAH